MGLGHLRLRRVVRGGAPVVV